MTSITTVQPAISIAKTGLPSSITFESSQQSLRAFSSYFECMTGTWNSERTYHYAPPDAKREDSQTTFDVVRLTPTQISEVLATNGDATASFSAHQQHNTHGFNVSFLTRMASQSELVRASTNLAFVPNSAHEAGLLCGNYYRDLGYEESAPIKATFTFECARMELTMTTFYTKVVSVDQISLINDTTRLRRIVNYRRPPDDTSFEEVVLVGFGIERKGEQRLVS
ncbi:Chromophore lyase CpcS/CpeS 1 [Gracilariopsis chorda]|uniref:Chromophore lyase CpcS/CpeS 1 n=2 Tax=Gracilariopsis TaxID=2781 RepID=A0A2V3J2Y7_9FLOR|nr:Chromophore lyase CpcS/CpeS 1 [Gracilariopsis chorda]UHS16777.1 phycocyanobilin lyase CpcU [Gracilariopsis lemaneiformis]|eukprot:PXF48739.1 Chromophore lyase CpcS/CpeS 1 [Gracilariopsis chorda]